MVYATEDLRGEEVTENCGSQKGHQNEITLGSGLRFSGTEVGKKGS